LAEMQAAQRVATPAGLALARRAERRPAAPASSGRGQRPRASHRAFRLTCAASAAAASSPVPPPAEKAGLLMAAWKFCRPHTIRGTILGSIAVTSRAIMECGLGLLDWGLLPRALLGVLALLAGNGYIVGINQIYDASIDKINKPFLPVAAGELSIPMAWALCAGFAGLGLALTVVNFGPFISSLYAFGLFLGTIYSVPPLRLKQFAVPAFMIIACVRGFLLNFGVYHATRAALGLSFQWSPAIAFITCFVTMFAVVIAVTKDLPDVEGDRKFNIETFATRLGVRNIAFLGSGLLLVNYLGAVALALAMPAAFNAPLMIGAHSLLAIAIIRATLLLDKAKYTQDAIYKYYGAIWANFYTEYLLFPFL